MRKTFVRREQNQQLDRLKKGRHRVIEDLLKCAPMFLLFYFCEIEGVSRYIERYP